MFNVLLLFLFVIVCSQQISQEDNQRLWSTYQFSLFSKLKEMQCKVGQCSERQAFQIIDSSMKIEEQEILPELCKYAPKWGTVYEPSCLGYSCEMSNIVKNIMKDIPNAERAGSLFLSHAKASKSWNLSQLASLTSLYNLPENQRHVIASFKIYQQITQQYSGHKLFWRQYPEDHAVSVPLKTSTFEMEFSAKNIRMYQVTPHEDWFPKTQMLNEFYDSLQSHFQPNGDLPLIPNTVFIAEEPKVVATITHVTYEAVANALSKNSLELIRIGGLGFQGDTVKQLSDSEFELQNTQTGAIDKIYFEPIHLNKSHLLETNKEVSESDLDACIYRSYARENPNICNAQPGMSRGEFYRMVLESSSSQVIAVFSDINSNDVKPINPDLPKQASASDTLNQDQSLQLGQFIESKNNYFRLTLEQNGVVTMKDLRFNSVLWSAGSAQLSEVLTLQNDGNLVVYDSQKRALWASSTNGQGSQPYKLVMQNDRNVVLYDGSNNPLWSTGTHAHVDTPVIVIRDRLNTGDVLESSQSLYSSDMNTWFTLEPQCALILRDKLQANKQVWTIFGNPSGSPCRLVMQQDGNLVLYSKDNRIYWISKTLKRSSSPYSFVIQNDRNMVVYGSNGEAIWVSYTQR